MGIWSWALAVIGVSGIYFVGRKSAWGWWVLVVNEFLWIAYAIKTEQYGFIFSAIAYAIVYIRSYIHWTSDKKIIAQNKATLSDELDFFKD
jgi:hypothetical protein